MEFDFKELVAKAHFDYVGPAFPSWWENNKTKFVLPNLHDVSAALLLGGRYFHELEVSYKGIRFKFPNEPLISLGIQKTIIETATVGKERVGTVKEYIVTEDYDLQIRGIIFGKDQDVYPAKQVEDLTRLFQINDSLQIESNPFLELFKIRNIVLKSIEFDDMAGKQGLQKYVIYAKSDQDFYADLTERDRTSLMNTVG